MTSTSFKNPDRFRKAGLILLILLQGVLMMSGSCRTKNTPVNPETKKNVSTSIPTDTSPASPAQPKETDDASDIALLPPAKQETSSNKDTSIYSMVAAFFSPGDGIDFKIAREFEAFLKDYKTVSYNTVSWGREGETDFCIRLDSLSPDEVSKFKESAETILKKSQKVQIQYNVPCRHYRKK